MFCKQCGNQVEENDVFCTACGAKLEEQSAQPAAVVETEADNFFGETQVLTQEMAFEIPAQPAYEEPVQPAYEAPVQPAYEAPVQPAYEAPVQPAYEAPVQPAYEAPVQPAYEAPVQPAYAAPAQPVYQEPVQPAYTAPAQPVYQAPVQPVYQPTYNAPENATPHSGYVGFGKAIANFFKNYVNFKGRASKSEYWFAYLFTGLLSMTSIIIPALGFFVSMAVLLPGLSLTVRRLHDIGKSWTFIFMGLIPIAGAIILLINMFKPSEGNNQWGLGPNQN